MEELDRVLGALPPKPAPPPPKKRRWRWVLGLVGVGVVGAALLGIKLKKDSGRAKAAMTTVHEQLDAGQCAAIWNAATDDFRKASGSEAAFGTVCALIPRKLGKWKSADTKSIHVKAGSPSVVTTTYKSEYANGEAQELFLFADVDDKLTLLSFRVVSPLLAAAD